MSVASSSSPMVGWELTYKLVENDITQKSEVIILLIHWVLIWEKDFKCVGLGSEKTLTEDDRENVSDLLPAGWNRSDVYLIRYIRNNVLYVLSSSKSNDMFIINFLHMEGEVASNIVINIDKAVKEIRGPITKLFTNHKELIDRIKTELFDEKKKPKESNPFGESIRSLPTELSNPNIIPIGNRTPRLPRGKIIDGINDLNPPGGGVSESLLDGIWSPRINRPQLPRFPRDMIIGGIDDACPSVGGGIWNPGINRPQFPRFPRDMIIGGIDDACPSVGGGIWNPGINRPQFPRFPGHVPGAGYNPFRGPDNYYYF